MVNQGVIKAADDGYIVLLSNKVENAGTLVANRGSVVLASAQAASLDFFGNGLVQAKLSGDALDALVKNSGNIEANGGLVQLATNARAAAINLSGIVEANSLVERDGVIRLEGGANSTVTVNGTLLAQGDQGKGGDILVTGQNVELLANSLLDASGPAAGGNVLVGGDYQGGNTNIQNANTTFVAQGARIVADATQNGDAGKVIFWSDDTTRFYGDISAQGGAQGGNGGFVEVSGKENLSFDGGINVSAANGEGGRVLFDPKDIVLAATGTETVTDETGYDVLEGDSPNTFNIKIDDVKGFSELKLQATNSITLNNDLVMKNGSDVYFETTAQKGAIVINAKLQTSDNPLGDGTVDKGNVTLVTSQLNIASSGSIQMGTGDLNLEIASGIDSKGFIVNQGTTNVKHTGPNNTGFFMYGTATPANKNTTQNDFNKVIFSTSTGGADVSLFDKNALSLGGTVKTIDAYSVGNMTLASDLIALGQGNSNSNIVDATTNVSTPISLRTENYFYDNNNGIRVDANNDFARWLVFAKAPDGPYSAKINGQNGFTDYDFIQFGETYTVDGKLITPSDNTKLIKDGFIYRSLPAFTLSGRIEKVYDGNTDATRSPTGPRV